jgi:hypothetical protein
MKIPYKFLKIMILSALLLAFFATAAAAQEENVFVVIRVAASRADIETSSEKPREVRFYISNVINLPNSGRAFRDARDSASDYLMKSVIEPLKAKSIVHETFYDDAVKINDGYILSGLSKEDAEAKRAEALVAYKEQWGNIYTFNWAYGQTVGLDASKPTLFYHNPEVPVYLPKGETAPAKETPKTEKPPVKKTKGKN